jgi:hypothetical protein
MPTPTMAAASGPQLGRRRSSGRNSAVSTIPSTPSSTIRSDSNCPELTCRVASSSWPWVAVLSDEPAAYGPCIRNSPSTPSTANVQPVQIARRTDRRRCPDGQIEKISQLPPTSDTPAKLSQWLTASTVATVASTGVVPLGPLSRPSGPLPTTNLIDPATGCESADTTR